MQFTRKQIYDLVWSLPLNKLAAELGLSDQGLTKACRRYDVPVPPVGYWQKLAYGKQVDQPSLGSEKFGDDAIVEISTGVKMRPKPIGQQSTKLSEPTAARPVEAKPQKQDRPHPILAKIKKGFDVTKVADGFAYINVTPFKIRASPLQTERVVALTTDILAAAPSENWEIKTSKDGEWELLASGERIEIAINENTRKTPHNPTAAEIRDNQRYSWNKIPEFDYGYIKHLLKLSGDHFTRNQLNDAAGTGSSTLNYCVGMENLGLIEKDGSSSGNINYRIRDPKVTHAIANGLDISKSG